MLPNETIAERNLRLFQSENPVAMVTGSGAPRVGRRVAETFLSQNFRVLLHSHHASREAALAAEAIGPAAKHVIGSVDDEAAVGSWVARAMGEFGRVDVLVNSAAIWEPLKLEQTQAADFERAFRVNLLGTALCCQHFGLAMAGQPSGGVIINIGDWATTRPYCDFAAYFLSKSGIPTLTRTMAVELAQRNPRVRVNAILPGPILLAEGISQQRRDRIVEASLLKREGTADDLAQAVLFLATSPFVTGVCIPVDGGRSIWAGDGTDSAAHPALE